MREKEKMRQETKYKKQHAQPPLICPSLLEFFFTLRSLHATLTLSFITILILHPSLILPFFPYFLFPLLFLSPSSCFIHSSVVRFSPCPAQWQSDGETGAAPEAPALPPPAALFTAAHHKQLLLSAAGSDFGPARLTRGGVAPPRRVRWLEPLI